MLFLLWEKKDSKYSNTTYIHFYNYYVKEIILKENQQKKKEKGSRNMDIGKIKKWVNDMGMKRNR